jgi:hypothetical protein
MMFTRLALIPFVTSQGSTTHICFIPQMDLLMLQLEHPKVINAAQSRPIYPNVRLVIYTPL